MTAAFGQLTGQTLRGRAGRSLCVLALVLPVPLCAALGLSLPLPATVERLAAKLVPFAQQGPASIDADGSIVLASGEERTAEPAQTRGAQPATHVSLAAATSAQGGRPHGVNTGAQVSPGARPDVKTGEEGNGSGAAKSTNGTEAAASTPAPAAPTATPTTSTQTTTTTTPVEKPSQDKDPGTPTQVVDSTVNTVNTTVGSTAETAVGKTESATETVKETAATATETATGVVGGGKLP